MPRPSHSYRVYNPASLCSLLHSPVTPFLLAPNVLLNTLFSYTLSLRSSLNVSDQVSHSYITGKIIVPYILSFKFVDSKLEDKRFYIERRQGFPDLNLLLISSWIELWYVKVVPKYLNSSTLSHEILSLYDGWNFDSGNYLFTTDTK